MKKRFFITAVTIYFLVTICFGAGLFLFPQRAYSENENRMLTTLPSIKLSSVFDKSLFKSLDKFSTDQFPYRDLFLKANAIYDLSLARLESGSVMLGDSALIKRLEYTDTSEAKKSLDGINRLINIAKDNGNEAIFICPPIASAVLIDRCPSLYKNESTDKATAFIKNECDEVIFIADLLRKKALEGEYVYYKTDHHWTSLGAYYAYSEIGKVLGYTPYEKEDFEVEAFTDKFLGTSYTASLIPIDYSDEITAFRFPFDSEITVKDMLTGEILGLYDTKKLSTASKYDVFLGGNRAYVEIKNGEKPDLIIVKDSFANSIVPFLSRHYNITLIDPRYVREDVYKLISTVIDDKNAPMLILINIDTIFTGTGL